MLPETPSNSTMTVPTMSVMSPVPYTVMTGSEYTLPGYAAAVASEGRTAAELERRLRHAEVPVVARVQQDRLCLSVRTLRDDEFPLICTEIAKAVAEG